MLLHRAVHRGLLGAVAHEASSGARWGCRPMDYTHCSRRECGFTVSNGAARRHCPLWRLPHGAHLMVPTAPFVVCLGDPGRSRKPSCSHAAVHRCGSANASPMASLSRDPNDPTTAMSVAGKPPVASGSRWPRASARVSYLRPRERLDVAARHPLARLRHAGAEPTIGVTATDPWPAASIAAVYRARHTALFSRARSSSAS